MFKFLALHKRSGLYICNAKKTSVKFTGSWTKIKTAGISEVIYLSLKLTNFKYTLFVVHIKCAKLFYFFFATILTTLKYLYATVSNTAQSRKIKWNFQILHKIAIKFYKISENRSKFSN